MSMLYTIYIIKAQATSWGVRVEHTSGSGVQLAVDPIYAIYRGIYRKEALNKIIIDIICQWEYIFDLCIGC